MKTLNLNNNLANVVIKRNQPQNNAKIAIWYFGNNTTKNLDLQKHKKFTEILYLYPFFFYVDYPTKSDQNLQILSKSDKSLYILRKNPNNLIFDTYFLV